jgi:hypothetical protein
MAKDILKSNLLCISPHPIQHFNAKQTVSDIMNAQKKKRTLSTAHQTFFFFITGAMLRFLTTWLVRGELFVVDQYALGRVYPLLIRRFLKHALSSNNIK